MANIIGKIWEVPKRQFTERERIYESMRREEMLGRQMEELKELRERERQRAQLLTELKSQVEQMSGRMDSKMEQVSGRMDAQVEQMSGRMDAQMEQLSKGTDAKLAQVSIQLDSGLENLTRQLTELTNQQKIELAALKGELADKIHTENVKSYRNVQALMEELEQKLTEKEQSTEHRKSARGLLRTVLFVGILNLLAVIGIFLYELGVFAYFF